MELESSLAGCLWPKVSYEVAVTLSARTAVFSSLDWGWRTYFQTHLHGYWQASGDRLPSLLGWPSSRGCLTTWQSAPSRMNNSRKSRKEYPRWKPQPFYNLILELPTYHFHHILLVRSKSINPIHTDYPGCEYQVLGLWGAILERLSSSTFFTSINAFWV